MFGTGLPLWARHLNRAFRRAGSSLRPAVPVPGRPHPYPREGRRQLPLGPVPPRHPLPLQPPGQLADSDRPGRVGRRPPQLRLTPCRGFVRRVQRGSWVNTTGLGRGPDHVRSWVPFAGPQKRVASMELPLLIGMRLSPWATPSSVTPPLCAGMQPTGVNRRPARGADGRLNRQLRPTKPAFRWKCQRLGSHGRLATRRSAASVLLSTTRPPPFSDTHSANTTTRRSPLPVRCSSGLAENRSTTRPAAGACLG